MQFSEKNVALVVAFLAIALSSASAKSIQKRDVHVSHFQDVIDDMDGLRTLPFVGGMISPYIDMAKEAISSVDQLTGNSLSQTVNSIMPCDISGFSVKCEGTFDQQSARKLAKKLLELIPVNMLPESMRSIVTLASEML